MAILKLINSKGCLSSDKAISPYKSRKGSASPIQGCLVPQAGLRQGTGLSRPGGDLEKALPPSRGRVCV